MADMTRAHAPRPRRGKSSGSSGSQDKSKLVKLGLLGGILVVLVVVLVVVYMPGDDKKKRRGTSPPVAQAPVPAPAPAPAPEHAPGPEQAPAYQDDQPPEEGPPGGEGNINQGAYPDQAEAPGYGPGGQTRATEKPQRPEDVADWKRDDYFSARADGDSHLVEAVGHLGKRFVGKATAARMLAQLLEPPKEENPDQGARQGYAPRSYQQNPQLVQAVVAALGINGTDAARAILEQLLAGTLPTDDDKAAVDAALKALVDYPSAKNDEILFRTLTSAEKLRPQPKGEIGPEQLREMALAAVGSTASEALRTKLAGFMILPTTRPQWREQMGGFLQQQHPDNVGAQLILYQSDQTPQETKATLEQYFTAYGSAAMAHALGIPPGQLGPPAVGQPAAGSNWRGGSGAGSRGNSYGQEYDGQAGGRHNVPAVGPGYGQPGGIGANQPVAQQADPDAPYRRARQLWSPQTVAMVEGRLDQLASLGEQAPLALLAGTFPVDSIRSDLWEALHKHWTDGPEQLESAGLSTNVVSDPGMLLTIKTLPRREDEDAGSSLPGASGGSYGTSGSRPRRGYQRSGNSERSGNRFRPGSRSPSGQSGSTAEGAEARRNSVERQVQAERDWMKASERLVRAWCERFHAAATARAAGGGPRNGESAAKMPIKLHPGANVVSEYHLNWPGELGTKLSGIAPGPMEVHYVRITEKADPVKRLGFYRRQLRLGMSDIRTVEQGSWLDRLQRVPKPKQQGPVDKTGWRRSTDVLVTFVQDDPQRERGEETDLVIQILSIEMKDPAKE